MNPSHSKQAKATATSPASAGAAPTATRVVSVDAYRGFVMWLMMAEVLEFGHVARAMPDSGFWAVLAHHQSHASWLGCSLHDLIQPSFSFLVGVALPFSLLRKGVLVQWKLLLKMPMNANEPTFDRGCKHLPQLHRVSRFQVVGGCRSA